MSCGTGTQQVSHLHSNNRAVLAVHVLPLILPHTAWQILARYGIQMVGSSLQSRAMRVRKDWIFMGGERLRMVGLLWIQRIGNDNTEQFCVA